MTHVAVALLLPVGNKTASIVALKTDYSENSFMIFLSPTKQILM
jgi:hypothetical protein